MSIAPTAAPPAMRAAPAATEAGPGGFETMLATLAVPAAPAPGPPPVGEALPTPRTLTETMTSPVPPATVMSLAAVPLSFQAVPDETIPLAPPAAAVSPDAASVPGITADEGMSPAPSSVATSPMPVAVPDAARPDVAETPPDDETKTDDETEPRRADAAPDASGVMPAPVSTPSTPVAAPPFVAAASRDGATQGAIARRETATVRPAATSAPTGSILAIGVPASEDRLSASIPAARAADVGAPPIAASSDVFARTPGVVAAGQAASLPATGDAPALQAREARFAPLSATVDPAVKNDGPVRWPANGASSPPAVDADTQPRDIAAQAIVQPAPMRTGASSGTVSPVAAFPAGDVSGGDAPSARAMPALAMAPAFVAPPMLADAGHAAPRRHAADDIAAMTGLDLDAIFPSTAETPLTISYPGADTAGTIAAAAPQASAPMPDAAAATTPAPAAPETAIQRHLDVAHDGAWLDRLARDIALSADRDSHMRFQLNPERLGALTVDIAGGADGASVRFTADNEAARALIADAQPRLVAEARAQGARIADAQVDVSGGGQQGAGANPFAQGQGQGQPQSGGQRAPLAGWAAPRETPRASAPGAAPAAERYA
ncbi:MAG: flagellar hook-length control protein FliK [Sphingomonas sp.]